MNSVRNTPRPKSSGPRTEDSAGIESLRVILERYAYPGPSADEVLGARFGAGHRRSDLPVFVRRMKNPTPLQTLVQLFILALTVDAREAEAAFAPHGWRRFVETGVLREEDGRVRATVGIAYHDGLWLAHDRLEETALEEAAEYVLGLNAPARLTAALTPRDRVASTLDVGTGCGIQAFLAARHSGTVVATDLSERALDFARFNARLNGVENVDFRQGDLFEPVRGERFDLIVSNPPYVVSPDAAFVFRDSGLPLDTVCRRLAEGMAAHLRPGGHGILLANWVHLKARRDAAWDAPPREWVDGNGCDVWILGDETHDPLTYAAAWNRSLAPEVYRAAIERWTEYYERVGIEAITLGALLLRRRAEGDGWVMCEQSPLSATESYEGQVARCFRSGEFLATHADDSALLESVLARAEDHEVLQVLRPVTAGYEVVERRLRLNRGFGFTGRLDATAMRLLAMFDGRRTLGNIVDELGDRLGVAKGECVQIAASLVRRLIALGFLVPEEGKGTGSFVAPRGAAGMGLGHETEGFPPAGNA